MNKVLFYGIVVLLYLLTLVFAWALLGAAVSKKYEVDEQYWRIESDANLNDELKKRQRAWLDERGLELTGNQIFLGLMAANSFILATVLLFKRNRLLNNKRAGERVMASGNNR